MWIYESTNAFGPPAAAGSTTASSGSTRRAEQTLGTAGGYFLHQTGTLGFTYAFDRWGSSYSERDYGSTSVGVTDAAYDSDGNISYQYITATSTALQIFESSSGSFGFTTGRTTSAGSVYATSSVGVTAPYTRGPRPTGTVAVIVTYGAETTTTATVTTTEATTDAGPTTTEATITITHTTSTGAGGIVTATITSYLYAPSTTITAPDSWIMVSDAEASEEAWEITATAQSAGYVSQLGSTFTRRSGLFYAESEVLPVSSAAPTRTMIYSVSTLATNFTFITSRFTSTVDTYKPAGSVYPVTATSTRSLNLLTTATTTGPFLFLYSEVTQTVIGEYPGSSMADRTLRTTISVTAPITYNANPTSTVAGSFHVSYADSIAIPLFRFPPHNATSRTASANTASNSTATDSVTFSISSTFTDTGTNSYTTTATTTGVDTTTASGSYTESSFYNGTVTSTVFNGGTSYTDPCAIPAQTNTGSYIQTIGATTETIYSTITHAAPAPHTVSEETYAAYTTTATSSSENTVTTTTSGTSVGSATTGSSVTETTSATSTASVSDFSTVVATYATSITEIFNDSQGISITRPILYPQVHYEFSTPWTVHAFHPRPGFSIYDSSGLYSGISLAGGGSFYYPFRATQLDSAGPAMPLLFAGFTTYANGNSLYTAFVDSAFTGLSYTHQATTQSLGSTITTASSSGTISFNGEDAATWYVPQSSAEASRGSRIGGQAARSTYGLVAYFPPGIRNWTVQSIDSSGLPYTFTESSWITSLSTRTASAEAQALPHAAESVYSVSLQETGAYFGGAFSTSPYMEGATVRPVITLSKFPNL